MLTDKKCTKLTYTVINVQRVNVLAILVVIILTNAFTLAARNKTTQTLVRVQWSPFESKNHASITREKLQLIIEKTITACGAIADT